MEVHTWMNVEYRGYQFEVVVEGVYDRRYDELDYVSIRDSRGFPISKRLENVLMEIYGDDIYEKLYEEAT